MKPIEINIHPSEDVFDYGCCATLAIGTAFNVGRNAMNGLCEALRYKGWRHGLTFVQVKRLITLLDYRQEAKYYPNRSHVEYGQLITVCPDDKFLVMFDEHLSYAYKGEVIDGYLYGMEREDRQAWMQMIPTGWWKL